MAINLVKHVFQIVGAVLLAMLIYQLLFAWDTSALTVACHAVEYPISHYYYDYGLYPTVHNNDGLSESIALKMGETYRTNNVSILDNDDTDNLSDIATYSTGWK